mmetsp:Transcript_28422/g.98153  ORF Transcript_28422/g.98153 Transcript_28422/m.98153 type:complete len:331 (+) Transcript_28422:430-1422(+)
MRGRLRRCAMPNLPAVRRHGGQVVRCVVCGNDALSLSHGDDGSQQRRRPRSLCVEWAVNAGASGEADTRPPICEYGVRCRLTDRQLHSSGTPKVLFAQRPNRSRRTLPRQGRSAPRRRPSTRVSHDLLDRLEYGPGLPPDAAAVAHLHELVGPALPVPKVRPRRLVVVVGPAAAAVEGDGNGKESHRHPRPHHADQKRVLGGLPIVVRLVGRGGAVNDLQRCHHRHDGASKREEGNAGRDHETPPADSLKPPRHVPHVHHFAHVHEPLVVDQATQDAGHGHEVRYRCSLCQRHLVRTWATQVRIPGPHLQPGAHQQQNANGLQLGPARRV